jgi:2-oxoglutarate dehydrogenase complex dehydrogenase (E1) component-like enzyme
LTAPELPAQRTSGGVLPAPEHPELPPEALQAFVEVDRKCGVFIFPQLKQLGATSAVEELVAAALLLAETAAAGTHSELVDSYRDLLERAQSALREARTAEVRHESEHRDHRQSEARLASSLLNAKSRLPAARMARLQQRLTEVAEGEGGDRVAVVEAAVAEWERLSQVRQSREAERLADRAHLAVRPRQQETARSRKALRDQAKVVELARAFALGNSDRSPDTGPEGADQSDQ